MIGTIVLTAFAVLFLAGFVVVSVTKARNSAHRVDSLREDEERAAREAAQVPASFAVAPGYEVSVRQA